MTRRTESRDIFSRMVYCLTGSFFLHVIVYLVFLALPELQSTEFTKPKLETTVRVQLIETGHSKVSSAKGHRKSETKFDLRPAFVKDPSAPYLPNQPSTYSQKPHPSGITNAFGRNLLFTESKITDVFDRLALQINSLLDYPQILVENGVQGTATVDLYFNHEGKIDESKSEVLGQSRVVRGLVVKAVRKGLVGWYGHDVWRINKEQFRDQHFRADFEISFMLKSASELLKSESGSYAFLRRRFKSTCLGAAMSGDPVFDLVCFGMKAVGSIRGFLDNKYKNEFEFLKEHFEHYDRLELSGINEQIIKSS